MFNNKYLTICPNCGTRLHRGRCEVCFFDTSDLRLDIPLRVRRKDDLDWDDEYDDVEYGDWEIPE